MDAWWNKERFGFVASVTDVPEQPPSGKVRFPDVIREGIVRAFNDAMMKANPESDGNKFADVFVTNLEWYAERKADDYGSTGLTSQESREKIEAVANALDNLASALDKAPALQCWMLMVRGLSDSGFRPDFAATALPIPLPIKWPLREAGLQPSMQEIASAFRSAIPARKGWQRNTKRYFELFLAIEIVACLNEHGIPVSTSSTGLAGLAFEETCILAGKGEVRASYWIRGALDEWRAVDADRAAASVTVQAFYARQLGILAMLDAFSNLACPPEHTDTQVDTDEQPQHAEGCGNPTANP